MQAAIEEITNQYFRFPGSSIEFPVYQDGQLISFTLIEVGCLPRGKRQQLKGKKKLLHELWMDEYPGSHHLPEVYRHLVSFNYNPDYPVDDQKRPIDTVMSYQHITKELLEGLGEEYFGHIMARLEKKHQKIRRRDRIELERILSSSDADGLLDFLRDRKRIDLAGDIRGELAEAFTLQDIDRVKPEGMSLLNNHHINFFNKDYRNGTEVDGVLIFYGISSYLDLLYNLKKKDYLFVNDRWSIGPT
ncbi:MAG: hypothetical protein GXP63_01400 [DPANN group archaeon]|nr:hypothetical protein [DPANN group archaeon]